MSVPSSITKDRVSEILQTVVDPLVGGNIVAAGRLSAVVVSADTVTVTIDVPVDEAPRFAATQTDAQAALEAIDGITRATVVIATHSNEPKAAPKTNAAPQKSAPPPPRQGPLTLDGIGAAVAIASGKGGVGKSTTALHLAIALHQLGLRVGLLDADVYGPSVPLMTGLSQKPSLGENQKLDPLHAHGISCMSIGFLMDADTPVVWRGPMVVGALEQLIRDVNWAPLDVLLLDLPPGTGDIQLSLVQKVPLSGAVIVSTPQAVALGDVRKGIGLFDKTHVPITGVIENMSHYVCPSCGHEAHIFGQGGAEEMANELKIPFLGRIPLDTSLREAGDKGEPYITNHQDTAIAQAYTDIALKVAADIQMGQKPRPEIRMA